MFYVRQIPSVAEFWSGREKSVDIKIKHQGRNSMLHSASSLTEHSVQLASFGSWQTGHIMLVHSLNRLQKHTGEKTNLTRLDLELRDTQPSVHSLVCADCGYSLD